MNASDLDCFPQFSHIAFRFLNGVTSSQMSSPAELNKERPRPTRLGAKEDEMLLTNLNYCQILPKE